MKLIELHLDQIAALCRKYKVAKLWVFGSILTSRFNDKSDVDFSVVFHYDQIPDLFLTFLDLVDETAIKNDIFRKELDNTKQLIYG